MRVFLLYQDHHVIGVFERSEDAVAEACRRMRGAGYFEVEPWTVTPRKSGVLGTLKAAFGKVHR